MRTYQLTRQTAVAVKKDQQIVGNTPELLFLPCFIFYPGHATVDVWKLQEVR